MFAIIGDVHGCIDELSALMRNLPPTDMLVFVGDMVDKGPYPIVVLQLIRYLCESGRALAILGNHDDKFRRYLNGSNVKVTNELGRTIAAWDVLNKEQKDGTKAWLDGLPYILKLDADKLFVSHAGCEEAYQDVWNDKVRSLCLYGKTNGQISPDGFPVRLDWAENYRGRRTVVHGHVVVDQPAIKNKVYNIDTGCYKGGKLTAVRYPSMEIVTN